MEIINGNNVVFKLANGQVMILLKEDYDIIVNQLKIDVTIEMVQKNPKNIYFEKDYNESKTDSLYRILKDQEKTMPEDLRNSYLKAILEMTKSSAKYIETLEERVDRKNPQ
jgi:hypothetical protein